MDVPIHGHHDPGFERLREAFVSNWTPTEGDPGELGASLCVVVDGTVVVDLWGGWRDRAHHRDWQRDTLVNGYSVGKALTTTTVLALVGKGQLDLDEALEVRWPEFAAHGKDSTTLRDVLSHRAGLPCTRERPSASDAYDFHEMAALLAATEPWWEPGTAHGYHVNTFGHLAGEPATRATGSELPDLLQREVCGPCGADVMLAPSAQDRARFAEIDFPAAERVEGLDDDAHDASAAADAAPPVVLDEMSAMRAGAYFSPPELSGIGVVNSEEFRSAVIPSTNMACTARGVARVFAALAGSPAPGTTLAIPEGLVAEATTTHSEGEDLVLQRPSRFGLGFMLHTEDRPIGLGPASFGHFGHGGSLGFADPDARVGFCFLTNRPGDRWQMPRTRRLLAALTSALDG